MFAGHPAVGFWDTILRLLGTYVVRVESEHGKLLELDA